MCLRTIQTVNNNTFNIFSFHFSSETVTFGKVELGMHRNLDLQLELSTEHPTKLVNRKQNIRLEIGSSGFNEQFNKGHLDLNSESPSSKLKYEETTVTGLATNLSDCKMDVAVFEAPSSHPKTTDVKNKDVTDSEDFPSLELGLKRLRGVQTTGKAVQDERNVLRRSDSSAFSRYVRKWSVLPNIVSKCLRKFLFHQ